MVLRGLWKLTWLEIKIFLREPLGVVGTIGLPVLVYVGLGRLVGSGARRAASDAPRAFTADLPILSVLLIVASAVLSLVAIVAIYREGGILRRLRATPLRPHTILTAHVLAKLVFTLVTLAVMILAGRRYFPIPAAVPIVSFTVALLFTTVSLCRSDSSSPAWFQRPVSRNRSARWFSIP
jgi:ABC-2 type transport system permease protein